MYTVKLTQIASEYISKLDSKSQQQLIEKIEVLKTEPLKAGKSLKGNLQNFRSIRSSLSRQPPRKQGRSAVPYVMK